MGVATTQAPLSLSFYIRTLIFLVWVKDLLTVFSYAKLHLGNYLGNLLRNVLYLG